LALKDEKPMTFQLSLETLLLMGCEVSVFELELAQIDGRKLSKTTLVADRLGQQILATVMVVVRFLPRNRLPFPHHGGSVGL
jgi:hypothetical protein